VIGVHWSHVPRPGWRGGMREWIDHMFSQCERLQTDDSILPDLTRFVWSAFCIQWVAISWCAVIGKETP
jgi:hypothetical protein